MTITSTGALAEINLKPSTNLQNLAYGTACLRARLSNEFRATTVREWLRELLQLSTSGVTVFPALRCAALQWRWGHYSDVDGKSHAPLPRTRSLPWHRYRSRNRTFGQP